MGSAGRPAARIASTVVAGAAFAGLVAFVLAAGIDVPHYDQWHFAEYVLRPLWEGEPTFAMFEAQHGPHRLLFPKLLMAGLALATGWNTAWERLASVGFALLFFLGLAKLLSRLWRETVGAPVRWPLVVVAALVCSLHQWENWVWGFQLQIPMCAAAFVWAIAVLGGGGPGVRTIVAAAALGAVCSFSFGIGLLVWPLGLAAIATRAGDGHRVRHATLWCALAGLAGAAWVAGYARTPGFGIGPTQVATAAAAFGTLFGVPILGPGVVAQGILGWSCLAVFAALAAWALRVRHDRPAVMPLLLVGLFSVAGGVLIGLGRLKWGVDQALSSRYVTITTALWISVLALAHARAADPRHGTALRRRVWAAATTAALGALLPTQPAGYRAGMEFRAFLADVRHRLVTGEGVTPEFLTPPGVPVNAGLARFGDTRNFLLRHRLSLFRDPATAGRAVADIGPWLGLSITSEDGSLTIHVTGGMARGPVFVFVAAGGVVAPLLHGSLDGGGRLAVETRLPAAAAGVRATFCALALYGPFRNLEPPVWGIMVSRPVTLRL